MANSISSGGGVPFRYFTAAMIVLAASAQVALAQGYAYPKAGQSQEVQQRDRYECHEWGVKQSGFDPALAHDMHDPPLTPPQHQGGGPNAAKGAATGAIMGNAARGAAIGAIRHVFHEHKEEEAKQKQAAAAHQMDQKQMELASHYQRAYKACMEARNYVVE